MAKHRGRAEIAALLRAIERPRAKGVPVADGCRAQGVTGQSYYRWRSAAADRDDTTRRLRASPPRRSG